MARQQHHGIAFSTNYGTGLGRLFFNAGTALYRLQSFKYDIDRLVRALDAAPDEGSEPFSAYGPAHTLEIVDYYAVGIVTCLEWHARSRLADLLTYRPDCLNSDDLKPLANPSLMLQMIQSNVSPPQLIAGMGNISTREKYLNVFERIYKALGVQATPQQVINAVENGENSRTGNSSASMGLLEAVFNFRNELVHEIGLPLVGSWNYRFFLEPPRAAAWCDFVERCMLALEKPITEVAGKSFPNALDDAGHSTSEHERLDLKIAELEDVVSKRVHRDNSWVPEWDIALLKSRESFNENSAFHSMALFTRGLPNTEESHRSLREGRIAYLEAVIRGLNIWSVE